MSISRRLSQSNPQRARALTTAKNRKDNVAPADNVTTPATGLRLDAIEPAYRGKMQLTGSALTGQTSVTRDVAKKKGRARMYISHFFQSFNNGVDRDLFPADDRGHYQLDINSNSVPNLESESAILLWGDRVKTGDAARVLAGGAAMAMPTAAEVDVEVQAFKTANNLQSTRKLAYDTAQEAVDALNPEADAVIKKVWDEAETFYNELPAPGMRRKCREWGVVYVSDIQNIIHVTVLNAAGNTPLAGAIIEVIETGDTFSTDGFGKVDVKTNVDGSVTLRVSATDFIDKDATVDLTTGGHDFSQSVTLTHV